MLKRDYPTQYCSMAASLEIIGERWTILIVRDLFLGRRRFDDIQNNLGVARNILQARLERLLENGIIRKEQYQERPVRYEYRLTEKGIDLWPILVSLLQWGDRYALEGEPPIIIEHKGCGGELDEHRRCRRCGADVNARAARAVRTGAQRPDDRATETLGEGVEKAEVGASA